MTRFEQTAQVGRLTLRFRASPITNLVYHLDALAGLLWRNPDPFRTLWSEPPLLWIGSDTEALARWRHVGRRYQVSVPLAPSPPASDVPLPVGEEIQVFKKLRSASFGALDVDHYRQQLELVASPEDADLMAGIVERFLPRFMRWWEQRVGARARELCEGFAECMGSGGPARLIEDAMTFYQADTIERPEYAYELIIRGDRGGAGLHGEQVGAHAVVELFPDQIPEMRFDVAVHELFHHLYRLASRERHAELARAFCGDRRSWALAAYHLLDESVAACLGNGLGARMVMPKDRFARDLATPGTFYSHPRVDALAKALMPVLEARLVAGETLYDDFAQVFLSTMDEVIGVEVHSPHDLLWTLGLVSDAPTPTLAERRLIEITDARSIHRRSPVDDPRSAELFRRYPQLSGGLLLTRPALDRLHIWSTVIGHGHVAAIRDLGRKRPRVVYGVPMSPRAHLFVFVGEDEAALAEAVSDFAWARRPFAGPLAA